MMVSIKTFITMDPDRKRSRPHGFAVDCSVNFLEKTMQSLVAIGAEKRSAWLTFFLAAGNFLIFLRHFLASVWVLFGLRQEVVTGTGYQWPVDVSVFSLFSLFFSLLLLVAIFFVLSKRHVAKSLLVICLSFFFLAECYETVMLHLTYGPIRIDEITAYAYGPLMLVWTFFNWIVLRKNKGVRFNS